MDSLYNDPEAQSFAKKFGNEKLNDDTINIRLTGSAGQSLGAFLAKGIKLIVNGGARGAAARKTIAR